MAEAVGHVHGRGSGSWLDLHIALPIQGIRERLIQVRPLTEGRSATATCTREADSVAVTCRRETYSSTHTGWLRPSCRGFPFRRCPSRQTTQNPPPNLMFRCPVNVPAL